MKKLLLLIAAATMLVLTGCASIVSKSTYPVSITSNPTHLAYTLTNDDGTVVASGETPTVVNLESGGGYFQRAVYTLTVKSKKFGTRSVKIRATIDGWYFGNILFGGPLGFLVVDPLTGAMWKLQPSVHVDMHSNMKLGIRDYRSLSQEERAQLIPIETTSN